MDAMGLSAADAAGLASDRGTAELFEAAVLAGANPKRAGNLVINVLGTLANERGVAIHQLGIDASRLAQIAGMIDANKLGASSALPLLRELGAQSVDVESLAARLGLIQVSDSGAIEAAIDAAIAANPKAVADFQAGKQAAMGSLVGAVMKSGKGLNARLVQERLRERLSRR
jgi:aspartyl-tRNA(Asn)/glutamyl-tRNA(Gln) amidotransferase subunit B